MKYKIISDTSYKKNKDERYHLILLFIIWLPYSQEVGFLNLTKHLVEFEPGSFHVICNFLTHWVTLPDLVFSSILLTFSSISYVFPNEIPITYSIDSSKLSS